MKWNEKRNEKDDGLDLPSLQQVSFGEWSFENCHFAQFESMEWLLLWLWLWLWLWLFVIHILDLPKLTTIQFDGEEALAGYYDGDNCQSIINGWESYDNTLIMKSMLILILITV